MIIPMNPIKEFIFKHHIQTMSGRDDFKGKFDPYRWSAPLFQQPDLLQTYAELLGLPGAVIQGMALIGDGSDDRYPDALIYEYDWPLVLLTSHGNFEIEYTESATVRLSRDCIPKSFYHSGRSLQDFADCLRGDMVTRISTQAQTYSSAHDEFTYSYTIVLEEHLPSYLKELRLHLQSGRCLVFTNEFDWGTMTLLARDGHRIDPHHS